MAAQFQFVMRTGPTPGSVYSLEGDQLIIGRDAASGVAIDDAEVSRKHARLTFQGGKYVIEDLGSTNGTFVNGQRVTSSVVLKSGDVVSFGEQIVLMYEALSADAGATMIGRKVPARPAPAQAPAAVPAPQQFASAPARAPRSRMSLPLIIGIGALAVICLCVVVFVAVDQLNLWCQFPFSLITPIIGGSC